MPPILLDGRRLAVERLPRIAARAARVLARRGRAPRLLLVAFAEDDGSVRHVGGKLRACAAAGVEAVPLVLAASDGTQEAIGRMRATIAAHDPDAVFVQVPLPPALDEAALTAAIPPAADVDVMTPAMIEAYMGGASAEPPVTVAAALQLLDENGVQVRGLSGVVVAERSSFALMFELALRRRGAAVRLLEPVSPSLKAQLEHARLVVAAVGRPGAIAAAALAEGAVALDIGYFNQGGRGDIDVAAGTDHLAALMPVPGGVGPMTVSMLVERVVAMSEQRL